MPGQKRFFETFFFLKGTKPGSTKCRLKSPLDLYKARMTRSLFEKKIKEVDEFGTSDCVICMDTFVTGAPIRKIPSCRHIFHDDCIMKWLHGENQIIEQKCPQCNSVLTPAILEVAIHEESQKGRRGGSATRDRAVLASPSPLIYESNTL